MAWCKWMTDFLILQQYDMLIDWIKETAVDNTFNCFIEAVDDIM